MSEEMRRKLVQAVIIKLLEFATNGAFKLMWADWETGRVMFKMDPTDEQVNVIMQAVQQAGGA